MALSLLKAGAIAATALIISASGAFAAAYGYVNYDTKVKASWYSGSSTVSWVEEGDYVKVLNYTKKNGGWFKIDPPGPNNAGWVKSVPFRFVESSSFDASVFRPSIFFKSIPLL